MNLKVVPNGPYIGQYKLQDNKDTIAYIHIENGSKEISFLSHRFKLAGLREIIDFVDGWQEVLTDNEW